MIDGIEAVFDRSGVVLRKDRILRTLFPKKYQAYLDKQQGDPEKARDFINDDYALYDLFEKLGVYQDKVNSIDIAKEFTPEFQDYDQYIEQQEKILQRMHKLRERSEQQRLYFYEVIYPLIFRNVRTSILEHQFSPREEGVLLNA